MKKKRIASAALAVAMGFSTFSIGTAAPLQEASAANPAKGLTSSHHGVSVDLGIANDERLIEFLKKEGRIAQDATPAETEKALKGFLKAKAESAKKVKGEKVGKELAVESNGKKDVSNSLKNGQGNKLGQAKKNTVDPVQEESYDGSVREDKVLVLAIDFPDYLNSSITKEETDMFYEDYPLGHFQDMVFGENGYKGPNGENLVSMKQYYEQQSGGSYTFEGTVAGWYTADNPAAYYGANVPAPDGNDKAARSLVYEALKKAAVDPNVDLSEYDQWDRDDYDADGVYNEPDGLIDHLMVIHAGVGEEAGGGSLGGDAIWSHRSKLGSGPVAVPNAHSESDRWGGVLGAWDYTIMPEDGAAGVFAHEYGHDLGLPDEYDTQYTGAGEPVSYWSIMSGGSWAGIIPGTEPTGFSPYAKQMLQNLHGGNWLSGTSIDASDITSEGTTVLVDEGVTKGTNNDAVRIDLPSKENVVNTPFSGQYEYFSGSGDELDHSMVTSVDLTDAASAELNFKAWYKIETDWDYASVQVREDGSDEWTAIPGNLTTDTDPYEQNPGHGITGYSDGWVDANFDLSAYAGKNIEVKLNYWTDVAWTEPGLYVDDISVVVDGERVLFDDAESESAFEFEGFKKDEGFFYSDRYYLLEWRSHNGVDEGLGHIARGNSVMSFDPGLVVWYVDDSFTDNWTGAHPGEGYLGVVDADQHTVMTSNNTPAITRFQMHDAAFGLEKSNKMFIDYTSYTIKDNHTTRKPLFDDSADYSNAGLVDAGRIVPQEGLKFRVVGESADGTVGKVLIFK
ncbi:immune inhibitor A domain-containing protein [Mesobacillus harenae]|uniref:immune inhibitor A domain-containing protein n=1 Tax=Mesobacillus harenae TaxID=2213203 RepID=UPI003BAEF109